MHCSWWPAILQKIEKLQTRIISERYYSFFHYCLLQCRYVMLQKVFWVNRDGEAQAVVMGGAPPFRPRSDGTAPAVNLIEIF